MADKLRLKRASESAAACYVGFLLLSVYIKHGVLVAILVASITIPIASYNASPGLRFQLAGV